MTRRNSILVTGGAGFIGSNFVLHWLATEGSALVNLDKLTYAGNLRNLERISADPRYTFVHGDIGERKLVQELLQRHQPRAVVLFAAESHVDRSIHTPDEFVQTNVSGTARLLGEARAYYAGLPEEAKADFRFLQISTDEVYGSLGPDEPPFSERTPYAPNSPYAASKAAADHLVRAYHHTYGLPTLTTNCSNNYGPFQFPEKLIPLMILNGTQGKPLPVYGDGKNIRDWLFVADHCAAIRVVLARGAVGETYNIGGCTEKPNCEIVESICTILDELRPQDPVSRIAISSLLSKTVQDMIGVMLSTPAKLSVNLAGSRARHLKPAFAKPLRGTWRMKPGSARSPAEVIATGSRRNTLCEMILPKRQISKMVPAHVI